MKTKETKLINECYSALKRAFDSVSYHKHVDRALEISLEESKQHDRFRGDSISRGISVATEAKYFVIKRIFEYINSTEKPPRVEDYFSVQRSCFACYAMARAEETRAMVLNWLNKDLDLIIKIASWDYCDLIKTEDRRRFANNKTPQERIAN